MAENWRASDSRCASAEPVEHLLDLLLNGALAVWRRSSWRFPRRAARCPGLNRFDHPLGELAGVPAELGLDVVDLGPDSLTLEDPRADLGASRTVCSADWPASTRSRTSRAANSSSTSSRSITRRSSSVRTVARWGQYAGFSEASIGTHECIRSPDGNLTGSLGVDLRGSPPRERHSEEPWPLT